MWAYERILLSAKGEAKPAKTWKMMAKLIQTYSTTMIRIYSLTWVADIVRDLQNTLINLKNKCPLAPWNGSKSWKAPVSPIYNDRWVRLFLPEKPSREGTQPDRSPQGQGAAHAINGVLYWPQRWGGPKNCTQWGKEWMPSAQGSAPSWGAMGRFSTTSPMMIVPRVFTFGSTGTYWRGTRSGIITAVVNKTTSFVQSSVPSDASTGFSVYVARGQISR